MKECVRLMNTGNERGHMKHISFYTDYRKFLQDFYNERKHKKNGFSYRVFLNTVGIKSPSFFLEVVQGKRNLSEKALRGFIRGLKLSKSNANYFSALVHYCQSTNPQEKLAFLENMRGFRRRVRQKLVPIDHYDYYSRWYNLVIREQACLFDWKNNYKLLAKSLHPEISAEEARESIKLLLRLGFLIKDKNNQYIQSDPFITTGPEVISEAVRELNRKMAELGEKAVNLYPPAERDISSFVTGISRQGYALLKEEIQDFKERVKKIVSLDRNLDRVYNLNVQFFPVAKPAATEEEV
jgi:uncharacterized protein (TIGR02147 family)